MIEEKLIKNLRSWMARQDPFNGRRIIFLHPPKCGGTSVTHALRKKALASHDIISNYATKALAKKFADLGEHVTQDEIRSKLMLYSCFRGITFISGHLTHLNGYIEEVPDSYDLVTVLRNPVDRFVSKYYFTKEKLSVDEFIETEKAKVWGLDYLIRFSGSSLNMVLKDPENAYKKSLENLNRYSIVAHIEEPKKFSSDFKRLYGRTIKFPKFNQNRNDGVTEEQQKRIELLCTHDIALYNQFR